MIWSRWGSARPVAHGWCERPTGFDLGSYEFLGARSQEPGARSQEQVYDSLDDNAQLRQRALLKIHTEQVRQKHSRMYISDKMSEKQA